ncbi:MAG: hypothetical protein EOO52_02425 [Gammaproteobacteria bacterium]|nr:MAG: hypothetical protein EOO52_02425 [Gammaproteobacteria bacterium]
MKYYTVVISGSDIFFENYSSIAPVVGFIACRLIKAQTDELAIATAKRDILVDWNRSFNADRKLGLPALHLEHIAPFKGWIKPKVHHDYYWFTDEAHKQRQIAAFIAAPKKWFWQK